MSRIRLHVRTVRILILESGDTIVRVMRRAYGTRQDSPLGLCG